MVIFIKNIAYHATNIRGIKMNKEITNFLNSLTIPVLLMLGCNIIDYITGIIASKYKAEKVINYKGIHYIIKKVCLWLLLLISSWIDIFIKYSIKYIGVELELPYVVAVMVYMWIASNELISILENINNIGVELPPFLMPIVRWIKSVVETIANNIKNIKK